MGLSRAPLQLANTAHRPSRSGISPHLPTTTVRIGSWSHLTGGWRPQVVESEGDPPGEQTSEFATHL
eukprot:COSAG02_NODE_34963_length_475_cov_64.779255_1_plen_66_part_10